MRKSISILILVSCTCMLQDVCIWLFCKKKVLSCVLHCAHLQARILEVTKQRDNALENVTKLQQERQVLQVNCIVTPCQLTLVHVWICPAYVFMKCFSPTVVVVVEDREKSPSLASTAGYEVFYEHNKMSEVAESNALTCEHGKK